MFPNNVKCPLGRGRGHSATRDNFGCKGCISLNQSPSGPGRGLLDGWGISESSGEGFPAGSHKCCAAWWAGTVSQHTAGSLRWAVGKTGVYGQSCLSFVYFVKTFKLWRRGIENGKIELVYFFSSLFNPLIFLNMFFIDMRGRERER